MLAQRITQLNGEPNFDPKDLASRSHSEYADSTDLLEMLKEDMYAERIAIDSCLEVIRWLSDNDPTTRKLMEDILKVEEEHADDLKNLLAKMA
jgi:bacterioferritin